MEFSIHTYYSKSNSKTLFINNDSCANASLARYSTLQLHYSPAHTAYFPCERMSLVKFSFENSLNILVYVKLAK